MKENKTQFDATLAASAKQSQDAIDAVNRQILASETQSNAAIETMNRQIAASEHQAQEALYNQHKPVIVPVSTPASTDADIYTVVFKNKGIGVALNTWGTLTIVGITIVRYATETGQAICLL